MMNKLSVGDLRHILAHLPPKNQASLRATSHDGAAAVRNAQALLFGDARSEAHLLVSFGLPGGLQLNLVVSPCPNSKEYIIQTYEQTAPRSQNAVHFMKKGRSFRTSRRMLIHHFALYGYWGILNDLQKHGSLIIFPKDRSYAVNTNHAFQLYLGQTEMVGNWDMFFTTKLYRMNLDKVLYGPDRWKELMQQHVRHYINFRVGAPKRNRGRRARRLSKV